MHLELLTLLLSLSLSLSALNDLFDVTNFLIDLNPISMMTNSLSNICRDKSLQLNNSTNQPKMPCQKQMQQSKIISKHFIVYNSQQKLLY